MILQHFMDSSAKLGLHSRKGSCSLYFLSSPCPNIECYIASTPQTRDIVNDSLVYGLEYTSRLSSACAQILPSFEEIFEEKKTVVLNILRGGLNFGLREAIGKAFGFNGHSTSFLSAQRARNSENSEKWHITENNYKKLSLPKNSTIVIGDVVATGTSLEYGLKELVDFAKGENAEIRNILFFTFGAPKAAELLGKIDKRLREAFPSYGRTILVYLEGAFHCPTPETPLSIKLTGTDLVKFGAVMAPELIESQYLNPLYPLERCAIYDAGSRAFLPDEYLKDVLGYWRQVEAMSKNGCSYESLLKERFPSLDPARFGNPCLEALAAGHAAKIASLT